MKRLFIGALLALAASGCHANPYCLNCKDGGNGVIAPPDLEPEPDLAGTMGDMQPPPDLTGDGGPCAPTNGGIEVCDGIDNDCNGVIDDVPQSRLVGDPKNCGACGNECKFAHAFGQCVGGFDGGTPMCKENGCQPGYIDLDGDPTNGCEYVCTPTTPSTEVCDGKDNNCDGRVDEGFTTTWFDAANQTPKYDSDKSNCGMCGKVCSLGPGTIMACQGIGTNGKGQCVVTSCFNGNDASGMHQTYRHDMNAGDINTTGCEYHCPKPAMQTGTNCNPNGACTFPPETCNGIDDDCNFTVDDSLTDPGLNGPCPDGAPGKLCQDAVNCGKGVCRAGTLKCIGHGLTCTGSVGPSPDTTCNGIDDDCNGKVDDLFTATWADAGNQMPRYDSDISHCGSCSATKCALPHGVNICRLAGGDALGSCAILACDPGFNWVPKTDSNPAAPTCDKATVGQRDSTQTTTGIGCFYTCASTNNTPEICDGKDNDCSGCIDEGLTAPAICATKGVCAAGPTSVKCQGSAGWKCDYSMVPGVSLDGMGNLTATELQCDNLDNNCNGPCDENFPDVGVSGAGCTNPRTAKSCVAGQGVCQATGPFMCANSGAGKPYNDIEKCSVTPNTAAAKDELCNGKDDDCDGLIDEPTDSVLGTTTFKGWHDPVVELSIGGAPPIYVYAYEASRPDATATSPGSLSTRACANAGTLPWANVTLAQAQAACAGIKDASGNSIGRLCTATEWTQACNGNAPSGRHWSMSASTTSYQSQVCNDGSETEQRCLPGATPSQCLKTCDSQGRCTCNGNGDCNPGFTCSGGICLGSGAWPTGSIGSFGVANQCFVSYGASGGSAHDMSGNLQEWTGTPVALKQGTGASTAAGPAGQITVNGLSNIFPSDVGAQLVLSGATAAGNNGTFTIVAVNSATSVVIANPAGVAGNTNITWKFVYQQLRGGNFATPAALGDSCEFDFDIQKASFANTNLGFRCCSDVKP